METSGRQACLKCTCGMFHLTLETPPAAFTREAESSGCRLACDAIMPCKPFPPCEHSARSMPCPVRKKRGEERIDSLHAGSDTNRPGSRSLFRTSPARPHRRLLRGRSTRPRCLSREEQRSRKRALRRFGWRACRVLRQGLGAGAGQSTVRSWGSA